MSALLVALFGSFNKRLVERADPLTVTCVELGAGMIFLGLAAAPLLYFGLVDPAAILVLPGAHDAGMLLLLAMACTLLPFALSLLALRQLSAFQAQLAVNLEPVYAIVLAVLLLDEQRQLSVSFYLGVAIILLAVFAHPLISSGRLQGPTAEILGTSESKSCTE
jgi:drug/metabolite transporter (DMT)-like permease